MNRIQVWTLAARPKTLVAGIAPTLIGISLAMSQGYFNGTIFLMTLLTALSIQIGTNLTNDYFDFLKGVDTSERKGFLRVTQAGLVEPKTMKRAIIATFMAALISGSWLIYQGGMLIAIVLAVYILLSVLYTAGPLPLGYLGLGDILVLLFYGPGAVLITYYLQTQSLSWEPLIVGLSPGALSMAILVINNIRDIEEDRKARKRTLPVRWGRSAGKIEFLLALFLSFLPPLFFYQTHPFALLVLLSLIPAIPILRAVMTNENPKLLNPLFEKTAKLLWLFTLLFIIGWML